MEGLETAIKVLIIVMAVTVGGAAAVSLWWLGRVQDRMRNLEPPPVLPFPERRPPL